MKNSNTFTLFIVWTYCVFNMASCKSQSDVINPAENQLAIDTPSQIGEYVVATFEDSKGNLWFGTLSKGVAKYDGKELTYFTMNDGLPSNRVTTIVEDKTGNMWFGTGEGISKYQFGIFTNYSTKNDLCNNMISSFLIDSRGDFWIGTWGGVCKFDGKVFTDFPIPIPTITTQPNQDTKDWVTIIMEDSQGNIWFGRDGYGACKYDGKKFTHFVKEDGLYSNNVQEIVEGADGNFWFGSRVAEMDYSDANKRFGAGGVSKYDGEKFSHFSNIKGLNDYDVYEMYNDESNNMWISTRSDGLYKFDGKEFTNYPVPKPIVSFTKDAKGNLWLGCAGGLYRLNSDGIVNITTAGPWN